MNSIETPHGYYGITQLFGERPNVYRQFGMDGHNGIDIVGLDRNYSFTDGNIIATGFDRDGYGYYCRVRDDEGNVWTYAHFSEPVAVKGRVERWQDLGPMGTTGFSTGVHCHFGVKPENPDYSNGYKGSVDPLPIIMELNKKESLNNIRMIKQVENSRAVWVKDEENGTVFWIITPEEKRRRVKKSSEPMVATLYGQYGKLMRASWGEIADLEEGKKFDYFEQCEKKPENFESVN